MEDCIAINDPLNDISEPRIPKSSGNISVLSYPDINDQLRS
jgi:hypothetical protein